MKNPLQVIAKANFRPIGANGRRLPRLAAHGLAAALPLIIWGTFRGTPAHAMGLHRLAPCSPPQPPPAPSPSTSCLEPSRRCDTSAHRHHYHELILPAIQDHTTVTRAAFPPPRMATARRMPLSASIDS